MGRRPILQRLKAVDFYRKIPTDLTESTVAGAAISLSAAFFIVLLLSLELRAFVRPEVASELVVDRSPLGEPLRVTFNVTFPEVACEFATVDVRDALGGTRLNLTKAVRKVPVDSDLRRAGGGVDEPSGGSLSDRRVLYDHPDDHRAANELAAAEAAARGEEILDRPMDPTEFARHLTETDILVVNFFAPWCSWCQRLEPAWVAATRETAARHPLDGDARIRLGRVDCVAQVALCRAHGINAFPSIRVFRHGSDEVVVAGRHAHEAYYGDRKLESLLMLADALAESAGKKHARERGLAEAGGVDADPDAAGLVEHPFVGEHVRRVRNAPGCNLSGFLLAKKVPGTLVLSPRAPGHSFDYLSMNVSHIFHEFRFGTAPSSRKLRALERLHPAGLPDNWSDKLAGAAFSTQRRGATHVHYVQVVLTSVLGGRADSNFDAYEYTVQSHAFVDHTAAGGLPADPRAVAALETGAVALDGPGGVGTRDPAAGAAAALLSAVADAADPHHPSHQAGTSVKVTWTISPIQVLAHARSKPVYSLFVSVCAVLGGVLTLAGILDGLVHTLHSYTAKVNLGKQG